MAVKQKILAIIPARGGSKRIPQKNIKPLLGKPLIVYTIESALKSKYLDRIIVSTDDEEISQISKGTGAEVIKRPKNLAEDNTPTHPVVEHIIAYLGETEKYKPDIVLLLQPTSPLRTAQDIDRAIELFLKNKCESVVGVREAEHLIHASFKIEEKYLKPILNRKYLELKRQDLPKVYIPNGAIFISTPANLFKYKSFFCEKILPYIMPTEKSVDIDNEADFESAELLIRKNQDEKIRLGNKLVGEGKPCFIIAEAGVNHNGSLEIAKKLIDVAKDARADAVKFSTFKAEDVVSEFAGMAEYQKKNTGNNESQLQMLKKLELNNQDFLELKKHCDKKGIIFLSTPHTEDAVDFLEPFVPAYKIASGDLTNLPFLEKVAEKKKLIILSTGMADMAEVKTAVKTIKKCGNNKIIILHCTTDYPCLPKEVNLRAMLTLRRELNLPVGYSDHTKNIFVPIMAIVMGAQVLEKHFTLDKNLPGPDHKASLDPKELKEMIHNIREAEEILGSAIKKPTKSEKKIMKIVRKSIIAREDIAKNEILTKDKLIIKRPSGGIESKYLGGILGKKTKEGIKKNELVTWKKIAL
ncbi:MAG: N-acetylneuraminate synthase [Candidatus Staskawiczbacteria bacterium]|jgi:N-acetylneuraminate synthase